MGFGWYNDWENEREEYLESLNISNPKAINKESTLKDKSKYQLVNFGEQAQNSSKDDTVFLYVCQNNQISLFPQTSKIKNKSNLAHQEERNID